MPMADERQHPISVHHTRRVAKQRRNELIRGLENAMETEARASLERQRWLRDEGLPAYVKGFVIRKLGHFQWEVVAVAYRTSSRMTTNHGRKL